MSAAPIPTPTPSDALAALACYGGLIAELRASHGHIGSPVGAQQVDDGVAVGFGQVLLELRSIGERLTRLEAGLDAAVDNLPIRVRLLIKGAMRR